MDIRIFNKTKGLDKNQALNKNSTNAKKQKALSIQFRTKKIIFQRHLAIAWHKMAKIFPDKSTPYIQYIIRFLRKAWFLQVSSEKVFINLPCYYFYCFLFHEYLFDFLYFNTSSEIKSRNKKKKSKTLSMKTTKNYTET